MNLKQIITRIIAGETPDGGEIDFLKKYNFEEADRLQAVNAALSRELESVKRTTLEHAPGAPLENEVNSLRLLTKQLSEERDTAQKELERWKYRRQIGELADRHQFADLDYLSYLCEKNQIDLSQAEVADRFMADLRDKTPKFFRADIQPGAKTDPLPGHYAAAAAPSIADMLSAAPEITQ